MIIIANRNKLIASQSTQLRCGSFPFKLLLLKRNFMKPNFADKGINQSRVIHTEIELT